MVKIVSTVGGIILLGLLAWWVISLVGEEPTTLFNAPSNGPVTVSGSIVCLPHRDTDGPQTLECAYGLVGDEEYYYGLVDSDNSVMGGVSQYAVSTEVEVVGVFTLGEDEQYATVGTIEVESITVAGE